MPEPDLIRLNKFLAHSLGISRRQADDYIAEGRVKLDQQTAVLGARISPQQTIYLDNQPIKSTDPTYVYIMLHKPVGYVCSRRVQGETPTIYQLLPEEFQQLKTVGRLDKDSSGLLLLSNDGDFIFNMTHPKFYKKKVYEIKLDQDLQPLHRQMINDYGIKLEDGPSKLQIDRLTEQDDKNWQVTMSEGRNRQIRRTFASLGYTITKLHRISFGSYRLDELASGSTVKIDTR